MFGRLISILVLVCNTGNVFAQGPYNTSQNSYWPMTVGGKWVLRDTQSHSPTVFSIQSSPSSFGCSPLSTLTPASSPYEVDIDKIDPNNYWAPGAPWKLRWFLGVQPPNQSPAGYDGALYGFGWFTEHYLPGYLPATNDVLTDPQGGAAYLLIRPGGDTTPYGPSLLVYPGIVGETFDCMTPTSTDYRATWQVTWTQTSVTTPGYTGPALEAAIDEASQTNPGVHNIENWFFANGVGIVRIEDLQGGTSPFNPPTILEFVSYAPGSGSPVAAGVTFRDLLVSFAGTESGLNFDQWNFYYSQATNLVGMAPEGVCLDPSQRGNVLTIDQYLGLLDNQGQSCSTVHWDFSILNQVQTAAGTTSGLNWDQWNYYYNQATGQQPPDTSQVCMKSVPYVEPAAPQGNQNGTIQPNRWVLYTGLQWFALFNYVGNGCAS